MIWEGELKKVEAGAAIDRETAQNLLSRLFDMKTGKLKVLSPEREAQFRQDAEYFSAKLRREALEKRAAAEAILAKAQTCSPAEPVDEE
jgi:hypothetical protein